MTIVTNEPIQTESSGVTALQFRADTFVNATVVSLVVFPGPTRTTVRTFADERESFNTMFPMLLSRYSGEWVAISGGQVIEHDRDRKAVTRRFFSDRTRGPVYIGLVGLSSTVRQATPFRARRRA